MSTQRENNEKIDKDLIQSQDLEDSVDTSDTPTVEGRNEINSADSAGAQESVVSSARLEENKHGRAHNKPITGANPKGI